MFRLQVNVVEKISDTAPHWAGGIGLLAEETPWLFEPVGLSAPVC